MKNSLIIFLIIISLYSCKNTQKKATENSILSTTEKIAQTAGIKNWDAINEVKFTFSVNRMNNNLYSRHWTWNRNSGDVRLISTTDPDTVRYNQNNSMDSIQLNADRTFVNDFYWLIPEFKFLTDQGTKIIENSNVAAPISKDTLDMFSIQYGDDGGYTPGDTYDVYYDNDHNLKEWAYRPNNDSIIRMTTTFEKFKTINGIKVATDHRTQDNNLSIQ